MLDDTDERERDRAPRSEASIITRFGGIDDGAAFMRYLNSKRARLRLLDELEAPRDGPGDGATEEREDVDPRDHSPEKERPFFEEAAKRALGVLGSRGGEHDPGFDVLERTDGSMSYRRWLDQPDKYHLRRIQQILRDGDDAVADRSPPPLRMAIAERRLAAAKDGINACALRSLLLALPTPAPRIRQWWCEDDQALTFGWDPKSRVFSQSYRSQKTELTLLGPTERLVAERRDKLPRFATSFVAKGWDRLEGLSNSNQLSYVIRLDHDEQGILITGDSGFDGFAISSDRVNKYQPKLTGHLKNLAVVQVPHHGGINRHFYRALRHAKFDQTSGMTYLLLSHEPNSPHRPNGAFASYMKTLATGRAQILFTGQPAAKNIQGYEMRIAGPVPSNAGAGGEVWLSFGRQWVIKAHGKAL